MLRSGKSETLNFSVNVVITFLRQKAVRFHHNVTFQLKGQQSSSNADDKMFHREVKTKTLFFTADTFGLSFPQKE